VPGQGVVARAPQHPGAVEQRRGGHVFAGVAVGADGEVDITIGHTVDQLVDGSVNNVTVNNVTVNNVKAWSLAKPLL
jgi:hypothetical protein